MTVPTKHIKTLKRRLAYLESVKEADEANSYDLAEIAALKSVLKAVDLINTVEDRGDLV